MYAYVLASANDPPEQTWCSLDAARAHISTVERYSRLSIAAGGALGARIMEVEMGIRPELAKIHHREPNLSLSDVITIASQNNFWPLQSEFRVVFRPSTSENRWQKGNLVTRPSTNTA